MSVMKNYINILFLVFVTATCLIFAELVVRKIIPASIYKDERNLAYEHNADLGWFPKKNSAREFQGSRLVKATHNDMGFRDINHKKNNLPNITFLGDSFVWGYDVEDNERFTDRLRGKFKNKFNIYNLGVSGYGTDQEFILLQKYYNDLKPKMVFVIFCDNDFDNNSSNVVYHGYYKPYYVYRNKQRLGPVKGTPTPLSTNYKMLHFDEDHPLLAKSHIIKWSARLLGRAWYHLHKKSLIDPTYQILEEMNRFLNEKGSKLVVGTVNSHPKMEAFFTEKNISYINLDNNFRYALKGQHWTPEGHNFVANKISNLLKKQ